MAKQNFNFKKAFEELEKINEWFSGEDIDIDEALEKFKRGTELVKEAKKHLKEAENKFTRIRKELGEEE
ncbi:MAG: exodeoxyribonuclease VII small subunit [Patescibacteria group bacterium]